MFAEAAVAPRAKTPAPRAPRTLEETGIRRSLLEELALKIVDVEGEVSLRDLGIRMGLEAPIVEELFQRLRKAQLVEVTGMVASQHKLTVTGAGRLRAMELLSRNRYAGITPVSFDEYVARVRMQSEGRQDVHGGDVRRALSPLVLADDIVKQLGVAILSGTSMVLYGPSGTGKTAIAELIPDIYLEGGVWIPHAVEIDGQIIAVYDAHVHKPMAVPGAASPDTISIFATEQPDARWIYCERPRIITGGELTMDMLDLQYNIGTGYYTAPLQMKANNGVLVVDDFGRQRIRPEELLNRWIVPLDRHVDYLTLQGGKKFEIPFELLIVFSTNLDPAKGFRLEGDEGPTDEAFLRRIPNKVAVGYASPAQFHAIFERVCRGAGVTYDQAMVDRLIGHLQGTLDQPLRPCYPRDLVRQVCWEARYEGFPPQLTWEALSRACHAYFLFEEQTGISA